MIIKITTFAQRFLKGMVQASNRLHFIDAMRTFAILMMLQGHFIYEMLQPEFANNTFAVYNIWKYFRGITAPVFFTVSGLIFTYLLIKNPLRGWENPRVKKGIRRGLYLIFWGYLLRLNLWMFFSGNVNSSFWLVDVLHCIGFSLIGIVGLYLLAHKIKFEIFPYLMFAVGVLIFVFHPWYNGAAYGWLPNSIENYLTNINGSVFTLLPWFGYAALGSSLGWLFFKQLKSPGFYKFSIPAFALTGFTLIFYSSAFFFKLGNITGVALFKQIVQNNFLFIRLGDVLIFFSIFMILRRIFESGLIQKLGQKTLTIYILHFILLYGSWFGLGVAKMFRHQLNPYEAVAGAVIFILINTVFAYYFDKEKFISFLNSSIREPINTFKPVLWVRKFTARRISR